MSEEIPIYRRVSANGFTYHCFTEPHGDIKKSDPRWRIVRENEESGNTAYPDKSGRVDVGYNYPADDPASLTFHEVS